MPLSSVSPTQYGQTCRKVAECFYFRNEIHWSHFNTHFIFHTFWSTESVPTAVVDGYNVTSVASILIPIRKQRTTKGCKNLCWSYSSSEHKQNTNSKKILKHHAPVCVWGGSLQGQRSRSLGVNLDIIWKCFTKKSIYQI